MLNRLVRSTKQIIGRDGIIPREAQAVDVGVADPKNLNQQAPNRIAKWSVSQRRRIDIQETNPRFIGKNIADQPRPYAAIDLIAKQPIRFLKHTSVAVCDGNGGPQGHPKIFINIDQKRANTCGYCGLRFAKKEFQEDLEGDDQY